MPGWKILLPAIPGVQIVTGDVAYDAQALPRRYIISAAELTFMCWRIIALQAGA